MWAAGQQGTLTPYWIKNLSWKPPSQKRNFSSLLRWRRNSWTSQRGTSNGSWKSGIVSVPLSDKSSIQAYNLRWTYIHWPQGERYNEKFLLSQKRHPPSVTIWSCLPARGVGGLTFIPPGLPGHMMKRGRYRSLMDETKRIQVADKNYCVFHIARVIIKWVSFGWET